MWSALITPTGWLDTYRLNWEILNGMGVYVPLNDFALGSTDQTVAVVVAGLLLTAINLVLLRRQLRDARTRRKGDRPRSAREMSMEWRIWVPGKPKSQQSRGKHSHYTETIRQAATAVMSSPLDSHHIEIEIVFAPKSGDIVSCDSAAGRWYPRG